jgi:hypothetical protein
MARTNDEILRDMLERQAAQPIAQPAVVTAPVVSEPRPRRRSAPSGTYELVMGKLALLIALGLFGGIWWVGANFTLLALTGWGITTAGWGLAAWLIPLAITALETGVMLIRAKSIPLWLLWTAVLAIDVLATAVGVMNQWPAAFPAAEPNTWVIVGGIGLALALAPEWGIRSIVRELLK